MVTFENITDKTVRATYVKVDYEGFVVSGSAAYNKENRLSDASGNIRLAESNEHLANFNIYGVGEQTRINLTDCIAGRMADAVAIAEATLADLAESYPEK